MEWTRHSVEVIELLASGQRTKPIVHPCLPLSKTGDCLKVQNIGEKMYTVIH